MLRQIRVEIDMKLLVATRNVHKLAEIRAIFVVPALELISMEAFPGIPEVVEDGSTFELNAIKKAVTVALAAKMWTLADDSGLEVDALDGAPGVLSARYAGEPANYEANNRKLLKQLEGVSDRSASFRCVIALCSPAGRCQFVDGKCDGRIIDSPRGRQGFGYDPLFVPHGYDQTFAEMASELKNRISHRSAALTAAMKKWGDKLTDESGPPWR